MAEASTVPDEVAGWPLDRVVGQLVSVSVGHHTDGTYGFSDTPDATARLVAEHHVGGVCYFPVGDDGPHPERVREHLDALRAVADQPLLTSIDQEGGLVARMREPGVRWPSAMAQCAAHGADATDRAWRRIAHGSATELRAAGVRHVYAPVADVNLDPRNPVIGIRSASSDPRAVARFVTASVRGIAEAGLASCLKHFPGHGDTAVDSHVGLPVLDTAPDRWLTEEAVPFVAGIEAGVDAIMVGHLCAPGLDPSGQPATFSRPIVTGWLRERLGFRGVIVTDALDMAGAQLDAPTGVWAPGEACVRALEAGVDQLLMPRDPARCIDAVLAAVADGRLDEHALRASAARVLTLARRVDAAPGSDETPSAERLRRLADVTLGRALTWRDPGVTCVLSADAPVVVVHDEESGGAGRGVEDVPRALAAELRGRGFDASTQPLGTPPPVGATVVAVTRDAWRDERRAAWLGSLDADVVVCARSPYDQGLVEAGRPVLLAFGDLPGVARHVADTLTSGVALGALPIDLPDPADPSRIRWPNRLTDGGASARVRIRPYRETDRAAVARVCVRTGASGADATGHFFSDDLLPWLYALPYVSYAPELCLVVEADGVVVGYILGVADVPAFSRWWDEQWRPRFAAHFPEDPAWSTREADLVRRGLEPQHMVAPWHDEHPAELHIDLLPVVQGMGLGRRLMDAFLALLRERGVPGVTLGVGGRNTRAVAFYRNLGFEVLREHRGADGSVTGYAMWRPTTEGAEQ
ncbi:GNAT family N-acetyltransferase [uncultured Tessaracoccus sp.]|uniref:GNAT family N-acetyltransferase n=1 Tax=uncultured Tessaracoccus sp. TaxID=905023 RepID=UPI0025F8DCC2|nr:GNAT family N-acetyltransferase [uncultured Tessaracoccus sp.]